MNDPIRIGLLGPLDVVVHGRPVAVTGRRRRGVLAALALSPGRPVSAHALAGYAWDTELPSDVRAGLQTTVTRLRQALGVDVIVGAPGAYTLAVSEDAVDVPRFRRLVAAARTAEPAEALGLIEQALALWRGEPLQDVGSDSLAAEYAPRLTEEWFGATERRIDLLLALGRHADLVGELRDLTARHGLRESLWSRLMIALYRSGRQAEALEAYQEVRRLLADELGVDPGAELQATHRAVLTNDPSLRPPSRPPPRTVPRQLPSDLGVFTGRTAQLEALDELLESFEAAAGPASPIVIAAIGGAGGVGKTTLAVRWAHRVADRFPDGQLYLNLRGYGPAEPVEPAAALESLLRSLGVPTEEIPSDLDSRSALLRSTLATKRMLLVLDNARDAEQVRPLLPGGQCLVLVTSRSQLRALSAREGAKRISLDELSAGESTALLGKILGPEVVAAQPEAAAELAALCGHLPLALAIAGERAGRYARVDLARLVGELREERRRLDAFATGDDHTSDLRAVLSWSYRALDGPAARMFRLLGLHPGDDITADAAAALAGVPLPQARRLIDGLVNACQLQEKQPGRYELHDLLRAYAAERADHDEPASDRRAATERLLLWYLHTASNAKLLLDPGSGVRRMPACPAGVTPRELTDEAEVLAWFDAERANLIALVRHARQAGHDRLVVPLATSMWVYFDLRHAWADWLEVYSAALDAARALGDRHSEASTLIGLGPVHFTLGETDRALECLRRALHLLRELGDPRGIANAIANLGYAYQLLGRYDESISILAEGLRVVDGAPELLEVDRLGAYGGLSDNLAASYMQTGRYADAVETALRAVELNRKISDRRLEASSLETLGEAYAALGRHAEAVESFLAAVRVHREQGNRPRELRSLVHLGRALQADGRTADARAAWREALRLATELDDPRAAELRARLDATDP